MLTYRDSTALVTGASKGLGEVFADALASRGMNLVLVARSSEALEVLAKRLTDKYGVKCIALSADLADPNAVNQIATDVESRRHDILRETRAMAIQVSGIWASWPRNQAPARKPDHHQRTSSV